MQVSDDSKNFAMEITRFSIGWLYVDVKFFEVERTVFISTVLATSTLYEIFKNLTKFCPVPFPQNVFFQSKKEDPRYSIKYKDDVAFEYSIHWSEESDGYRWDIRRIELEKEDDFDIEVSFYDANSDLYGHDEKLLASHVMPFKEFAYEFVRLVDMMFKKYGMQGTLANIEDEYETSLPLLPQFIALKAYVLNRTEGIQSEFQKDGPDDPDTITAFSSFRKEMEILAADM